MRSRKRTLIIIAIVLCAILISVIANIIISLVQKETYPKKYEEYVEKYASLYNVPEYIIYAVIKTESDFVADTKSGEGALGLMQMMPKTFDYLTSDEHLDEELEFESLSDPNVAIRYGVYYLRYLFNRFHKWNVVFAAYSKGETIVAEWLADPKYSEDGEELDKIPTRETRNYVKKVNNAINYYKNTYYRNGVSVK